MLNKITLKKQAADGLIVKEIQHEQVRTQTFVDGKPGFVNTKDIKRMGYKDSSELIAYLIEQGYEERAD